MAFETSTAKVVIPPAALELTQASEVFSNMFLPRAPVSVEAIVISVALVLVNVMLAPSVRSTIVVEPPLDPVRVKGTLVPDFGSAVKAYVASVLVV